MKNIVIMLIFVVVLNAIAGFVITLAQNQSQTIIDNRINDVAENMRIESFDYQENQVIVASQSEYSTDLMPPVDSNPAGIKITDVLVNGITLNVPASHTNTDWEQKVTNWFLFFVWLSRIVFVAWVFILIWAKVVHT